jgi:hypothetical protein
MARSIIASGDATSAITQSSRPMTQDEYNDVQSGKPSQQVC